jgi:hypothetical protein
MPQQNPLPQSLLEMLNQMIPNYGALNNRTPGNKPAINGLWNGNGQWNGTGLQGGTNGSPASPAQPSQLHDSVDVYKDNSAPWANDPAGFYGGQFYDPSQIPAPQSTNSSPYIP